MAEQESDFNKEYSDDSFWEKVKAFALKAGREVLEKALIMYYCLQDSDTPVKAKAVIIGALGYFIMPFDAIPDMIVGVGFADDLGVLAAALAIVAVHVKQEHRDKAEEKLQEWFGEISSELKGLPDKP